MTKEEIIKMAKDSGIDLYGLGKDRYKFVHYLENFAKMVAERERDACCVGWFGYDTGLSLWFETNKGDDDAIPLYKDAQKRPWVGLTYEEESELIRLAHQHAGIRFYIQAAEAKLKEKNT
jgi:hypothetical protein